MSLLLLYRPRVGTGEPEPPAAVPFRTLMGVGLTLAALFVLPVLAIL